MNIKKIGNNLYRNFVDAVAICSVSTPLMASFETAAGFTSDMSARMRAVAACIGASGYFFTIARGREISEKYFKPVNRAVHDSAYFGAVGFLSLPILYLPTKYIAAKCGVHPPENWSIGIATTGAVGVGFFGGSIMRYSIDVFRDLANIQDSKRTFPPKSLNRIPEFSQSGFPLRSNVKKGLAVAVISSSLLLTDAIYMAGDYIKDKWETHVQPYQQGHESLETKLNNS